MAAVMIWVDAVVSWLGAQCQSAGCAPERLIFPCACWLPGSNFWDVVVRGVGWSGVLDLFLKHVQFAD